MLLQITTSWPQKTLLILVFFSLGHFRDPQLQQSQEQFVAQDIPEFTTCKCLLPMQG